MSRIHWNVPSILILGALVGSACGGDVACDNCDTLVIAAVGEPSSLFPPLVVETVGRDISDRIFERLADLRLGGSPLDPADYAPRLATSWERMSDRRWRFHLREDVTWHDGVPFTAEDVRFSFEVFSDPTVDALALAAVEQLTVEVVDEHTVDIVFPAAGPNQLYDATYHVRILPSHVWAGLARGEWLSDTASSRIIGTGPYRLVAWERPTTVRLEAAGMNGHHPSISRLVWAIQGDPDAAANLVLSHEADAMEAVPPPRLGQVEADPVLRTIRYPSAVYGFLTFNLEAGAGSSPLADRGVRRALAMAIDRQELAEAAVGRGTMVPLGPMSRLSWINDSAIAQLPYDPSRARLELEQSGWSRGKDGSWSRGGRALAFDILIPSTSRSRQLLAEALQEAWRREGIAVSVTAVDFPVFLERLRQGRFDSYIGAMLDEPSAGSLADQWTRAGWDAGNSGHYFNPLFDSLATRANAATDAAESKALWIEALSTLNEDAPAIFLFNPVNAAAVKSWVQDVVIDPYSWLESVAAWRGSIR